MKIIRSAKVSRFLAVASLSLVCLAAPAQDYRVLHHFAGGASDGARPSGSLIQSGSTLYGATYQGGTNNIGTVFRMNTDGTGFQVLHSFVSGASDGSGPFGLLLSESTLYGMTCSEGTSYRGTVFKMQTNGSDFQVLRRFSGTDGKWPYGALIQSGGMLYGLNAYGGNNTGSGWVGYGTLFQIGTNGTGFQVLHMFTGSPGDGIAPHGSLVQSGSFLYGLTVGGGSYGSGTVFKINTNGSGYQLLRNFAGGANDGSSPCMNRLVLSGTTLYAETSGGGGNDLGTVFRMNTDGNGFALLHSFTGTDGDNAQGGIILSGSTLYGMTWGGGIGWDGSAYSGNGVIYQIGTNGTGFQLLHKFAGGANDGATPNGSPLLSGSSLYGMTSGGGSQSKGVIFALDLLPKLAISLNNTNVNLFWSTNYPGFTLETTDQLTGGWTNVPGVTGFSATLPVSTNQFFRLKK